MRIDDELIDKTLRDDRAWHPPAAFAARTAARGVELLRGNDVEAPRLWSWVNVAAVMPIAVLTAFGIYFAGEFVVAIAPSIAAASKSSMPATWLWVAASFAVAAWCALRTYASD